MIFLIDAHLPKSIGAILEALGHEAIHTSALPKGNASSDEQILRMAMEKDATVISKDQDFFYSFQLRSEPRKLVLVKTGNLCLADTKALFQSQATAIVSCLPNMICWRCTPIGWRPCDLHAR